MKSNLTALLLIGLFASPSFSALAQQTGTQQPAAQQGQQGAQPPRNNLGKQVATPPPPQVVYPRPEDIVEDSVGDIEDLQLTPAQIDRLKQIYLSREKHKAMPYTSPAKPITRTMFVSLDPGVSPPVLRLTRGQQTSIVFSDAGGQPWFIENVSMNRQLFSDGRQGAAAGAQQQPTNVLTIEPLSPAAYGNVTVTLRSLSTPVIFVLTSAQKEVDMRVDAKIPGRNPDAIESIATINTMPSIDNALTYFLDGVPPKEARRLQVSGLDGVEAWLYRENLYVRAKADAQYPAYLSAARSTSGVSVYRYAGQHNSVTFLTGGQAVTVFIQ